MRAADRGERRVTSRGVFGVAMLLSLVGATIARQVEAQQPAAYRPGFHVRDYDIAIDVPDSGAKIHADATLTIERTAARDTLALDLLDLSVARVVVNGRAGSFRQTPESVLIALPSARIGDTTLVEIEYAGAVTDGLIVRRDSLGRWTYFGDNWPNRARHWIPSLDHPSDKATVSLVHKNPVVPDQCAKGARRPRARHKRQRQRAFA